MWPQQQPDVSVKRRSSKGGQVEPAVTSAAKSPPGGVSTKLHSLVGNVAAKGVEVMSQNGGDRGDPQGSLVSLGEGFCLSGR